MERNTAIIQKEHEALGAIKALSFLGQRNVMIITLMLVLTFFVSALQNAMASDKWQTLPISTHSSLSTIASKASINAQDINTILRLKVGKQYLQNLYPGDKLKLNLTKDKRIIALQYDIHNAKRLTIERLNNNAEFTVKTTSRPLEVRKVRQHGVIQTSLYDACKESRLPDNISKELIRIFDWDIDYQRDIHKGDQFSVLYEEHYRGGEKVGEGPILAAEFINKGKTFHAFRYKLPNSQAEYFTADGRTIRKPFLRNPVDYPLISSKFNLLRKHPILSTIRAHKGVDYAAKIGTPIKATSDGIIAFRGSKSGYGKTIIIQHKNQQSTLYAHLNGYAPKTQKSRWVKQGQIIAYVGRTGLATGPHLHYELQVNGQHVDPLSIKHSHTTIPAELKNDFATTTQNLLASLNAVPNTQIAWNTSQTLIGN